MYTPQEVREIAEFTNGVRDLLDNVGMNLLLGEGCTPIGINGSEPTRTVYNNQIAPLKPRISRVIQLNIKYCAFLGEEQMPSKEDMNRVSCAYDRLRTLEEALGVVQKDRWSTP